MNCKQYLSGLSLALMACQASANVCVTSSVGLFFTDRNPDINSATSSVLQKCQSNQLTNNQECANHLSCGWDIAPPYPSGLVACSSTSARLGFQATGSADDINSVVSQVIQSCQSNQLTNNQECTNSLHCGDSNLFELPYRSGNLVCRTRSANLEFRQEGSVSGINQVVSSLITECQSNQVTNNQECAANVNCNDMGDIQPTPPAYPVGPTNPVQPPMEGGLFSCQTTSHNLPFEQFGSPNQIDQLTSQVISQCQQNPVTNNQECVNNLTCGRRDDRRDDRRDGGFNGGHDGGGRPDNGRDIGIIRH